MSKSEQSPYAALYLFHQSDTGNRIVINFAWVRSICEAEGETVITYMNGEIERIDEGIAQVATTITGEIAPGPRRKPRN